jgi:hypothetical protein
MPNWRRFHDAPGEFMAVPAIEYPTTLERLIEICKTWPDGQRLHAAGSHWALSTAAMSDHTHIETHDPTNVNLGMARTLYDVVPKCMNEAFLELMRDRDPKPFEENLGDTTPYFVHVEAGKRIYQLYSELDWPAENDPKGLAMELFTRYGIDKYFGSWAFRTLGGAGGQTIIGALTTGTHGGDFLQPPIADSVAALHVVSDRGKHYWVEPAMQLEGIPLIDDAKLNDLYGAASYGGPDNFEIIRDDDVFDALLVSSGRFGVIYSVVVRAVRQYMLHEELRQDIWQNVRTLIGEYHSELYNAPNTAPQGAKSRFLQVAVCLTPHANFSRNLCGVTKRWNVKYNPVTGEPNGREERRGSLLEPATAQRPWPRFRFAGSSHPYSPDPDHPNVAKEASLLERACSNADFMIGILEEVCEELREFIENNAVAVGGAIAAVAIIGGLHTLLGLLAALAFLLAILLLIVAALRASGGGERLGQVLDDVREAMLDQPTAELRIAGIFVWQMIAYKLFSSQQEPWDYDAISYTVMDRRNYLDASCEVNVDSIEVFFSADDPMLIAFVDALTAFETRQEFQGKAFVGYASIRFTGKTRALIGPQRWERTAIVEVACLKDVEGSVELIEFAIALSRDPNFRGILHWGQRNESDVNDIQLRFGDANDPQNGALGRWRQALTRITRGGKQFSSAFTVQTGLEA